MLRRFLCGLATVFVTAGSLAAQSEAVMATEIVEPGWVEAADGGTFPEGPAWNGRGELFFSDCTGQAIYRLRHGVPGAQLFLAAKEDPFTLKNTNGTTFGADGYLYACEYGEPGILRIGMDGSSEYVATEYGGERVVRPNDLAFDPKGNLYFTDSWAYKRENPKGAVYRIDAKTGEVTQAAGELGFANGIAFSPNAKQVYVAESAWNRVLRYDVSEDGSFINREVFADMPGGDPDGMAFDTGGNLYVAHFGGGVVAVFSPDGTRIRNLKTPGKKPSNVEFAGADLRTLYVTEDETRKLYRTKVETPGVRLFWAPEAELSTESGTAP